MKSHLERFIGTSIGPVKNLFWFGFSADPPTRAHQKIIKRILNIPGKNAVVVFPAGTLSYKKFTTSKKHRLAMIKLWMKASGFEKKVKLSLFDFKRKQAFGWYDLWKKINTLAPKVNHWYVIGSDQYQDIKKSWDHGQKLLKEARFLIMPRKEWVIKNIASHHRLLNMSPLSYSSTIIRKGTSLDGLDALTKAYILKKRLYHHETVSKENPKCSRKSICSIA